jgi:CopG family nickel-responsive transcriptional regulator
MEIISLSVDDETLEKLEEIQEKSSFNGRSELFRKAISDLHEETVEKSELEGDLNALVVVRHPHAHEQGIGDISHSYDDVITTQLHSKLDGEKCLEVFHVDGKAERVVEFYTSLNGSKDTESVKLLPQS